MKIGVFVMKKSVRLFTGILVSAFILALAATGPAMAQDKGKDTQAAPARALPAGQKLLFENAKVLVLENRLKPGETAASRERPDRVVYDIKGTTLERTYPDGKKVKTVIKTGGTRWLEKDTFSYKNVGKTELVQIVVILK
jgi:hypothetical protein